MQYNDLSNRVYTFTTDTTPSEHQKKSTLLLYFAQYMGEHLIHGGDLLHHQGGAAKSSSVPTAPPPSAIFMKKWFRTSKAIVMYLNNGTLQVGIGVISVLMVNLLISDMKKAHKQKPSCFFSVV